MAEVKRFTLNEMVSRNKASGQHWFDPKTMGFFATRIEAEPDEKHRFITSEGPPFLDSMYGDRAYSIREFNPSDGGVKTVGQFRAYTTLDEAEKARRSLWK